MEPAQSPEDVTCLPYRLGIAQELLFKTRCKPARESRAFHFRMPLWIHEVAMRTIMRFLRDETAATAIEYGLIAAGISLAIIAIVNGLGAKLNTKFTSINSSLK
jgi:pilus assembly protein Flp/PilA